MNNPITRVGNQGLNPPPGIQDALKTDQKDKFGDVLKQFVEDVNSLQNRASESIEKLATGEVHDVHEVMIAVNEAETAMEFMLEIRSKIVEAYQEIMRMQV